MKQIPRCQAVVYRRDTYRYAGRTPSGFEMHYTEDQCRLPAIGDTGRCRHHEHGIACKWAEPFVPAQKGGRRGTK